MYFEKYKSKAFLALGAPKGHLTWKKNVKTCCCHFSRICNMLGDILYISSNYRFRLYLSSY